eukprot:TRINITY_DN4834_c0_g1_i1.p1 TRINITY_DN4834_c0_g1~~TRINITY_DN4834_c0_g1_i1.p1  ORF type:complete len:528 (+),score=113.40 TRINITY_DN4834_c0_g1_i1:202-1785(+)
MEGKSLDIPGAEIALPVDDNRASSLKRRQILTVALLYFLSFSILISRRAPSSVWPAVLSDPSINMTVSDASKLFAVASVGSATGNFFSGMIVNRVGGKIPLVVAGGASAVLICMFGLMRSLPLFMLALVPMRLVQSASSPSQVRVVSQWFTADSYGRAWGIVSSSSRLGAASGGLLLGLLEHQAGLAWSQVLWVAGGIVASATVLNLIFLKQRPEDAGLSTKDLSAEQQADGTVKVTASSVTMVAQRRPIRVIVRQYARDPRVWLMCFGSYFGTICFEFDQFVPIFLNRVYQMTPGEAGMASAAFPGGMFVSLMLSGVIMDKLSRRGAAIYIVLMLIGMLLCNAALWFLVTSQNGIVAIGVLLVFAYGFMLGAPAFLPQSLFAMRLGGKAECSVLLSLFEMAQCLAQVTFDLINGFLPGWGAIFLLLICAAALNIILFVIFFVLDLRADSHSASDKVHEMMADGVPLLKRMATVEGDVGAHGGGIGTYSRQQHSGVVDGDEARDEDGLEMKQMLRKSGVGTVLESDE